MDCFRNDAFPVLVCRNICNGLKLFKLLQNLSKLRLLGVNLSFKLTILYFLIDIFRHTMICFVGTVLDEKIYASNCEAE